MSLFGSLRIAANALFATQTGLQVTANNIANSNTPGYIRERAVFTPGPTQLVGNLPLGMGVEVEAIVQEADRFLAERLRAATGDLAGSEVREDAYLKLEGTLAELSDADLSTSLSNFFSSLQDILNQPEDRSIRNLAVLQAETLAEDFKRLDTRVTELRSDINDRIVAAADDANRLLSEVAELNVKIVITESQSSSKSDAVGLRDQRDRALRELAKLMGVRTEEQPAGDVTVFAGGEFLVFGGEYRSVGVAYEYDRGVPAATLTLEATDAPVSIASGEVDGLYEARDEVLGGFLNDLDAFTASLIYEFNKVHAGGQGLVGHTELLSDELPTDTTLVLDQAGLPFAPVNGSFQVHVYNTETGLHETTDVFVRLNGLNDDTSITDLAATLDAIEGITATITAESRLELLSDSPIVEVGFANDTSGTLAALGLNTFFTGSNARDIDVSEVLRNDPLKLATSQGGIGADTDNVFALAAFADTAQDRLGGSTLNERYEEMIAELTQGSAVTRAVSEGFRTFHNTLEGQLLGITGVSIDDEAVNMIALQRSYQASARMITTLSELLDLLVRL